MKITGLELDGLGTVTREMTTGVLFAIVTSMVCSGSPRRGRAGRSRPRSGVFRSSWCGADVRFSSKRLSRCASCPSICDARICSAYVFRSPFHRRESRVVVQGIDLLKTNGGNASRQRRSSSAFEKRHSTKRLRTTTSCPDTDSLSVATLFLNTPRRVTPP